MSKYRQGILYVRRLKPTDKCDSWSDALRLAADQIIAERRGKKPYVLVRHGDRSNNGGPRIMASGTSKDELLSRMFIRGTAHMTQRQRLRTWRDSPKARPYNHRQALAEAARAPEQVECSGAGCEQRGEPNYQGDQFYCGGSPRCCP